MVTEENRKPEIVVFAGPNGSGKSTFTELLKPQMDYINADEIKKNLKCTDLEAAQIAEKQREEHLAQGDNFCFETVMSTDRNLNLLKRAKEKGYFIRCYYILTADPMINVFRVYNRVLSGGHDVPKDKIISRYEKALALVGEVVAVSDICHIYDNSSDRPFRIFKKRKTENFYEENMDWKLTNIQSLTNVKAMVSKLLNIL
ncbi:zeta toxin family protein [Selenomonas sp. AE3005]|uniref:zeta toxin family protein n=1 Tax=Selenomonas sp. AE3005 TaxID=1485543 RepID=UPI0025E3BB45|nr:zeta toxin family protein [Selenomonas sp. AE3005]